MHKAAEKIKIFLMKIKSNGMGAIVIYSVINKIIGLVLAIIIVRILTKSDYGVYSYANNIISIFLVFSGLGIKNGILQFCCEMRPDLEKAQLYRFGFNFGLVINICISMALVGYAALGPLAIPDGRSCLLLMGALPILSSILDYGLIFLRTKLLNIEYAKATNIHSVFNCILSIGGAFLFGLKGYVLGQYGAYLVAIIYIWYCSKKEIREVLSTSANTKIPSVVKKDVIGYSITCASTNALSSLLGYLDVFLLGIILSNELVLASYKASSTIPDAAKFFTVTIMVCIYPVFANHKDDPAWLSKNIKLLVIGLAVFNGVISLGMYCGAEQIIRVVYGSQYLDAVVVFRILTISYFFATALRVPLGNILLMIRKEKVNFGLSIIAGGLNIVLDIILIPRYGSKGAAVATLIVVAFTSIYLVLYLIIYLYRVSKEEV